MKTIHFRVPFDTRHTHSVKVHIYPTCRAMLRALHSRTSSRSLAACRVYPFPDCAGITSELFFFRDQLTINTIVHECTHACFIRARLVGFNDSDKMEEFIATSAGDLAEEVISKVLSLDKSLKIELISNKERIFLIAKNKK